MARSAGRRWIAAGGIVLGLALAVALVITLIRSFLTSAGHEKPKVQQVFLFKPPPPPPPPKEEPKPEVKKEEVKIPEPPKAPEQQQSNAPEGKQLGLDADATAGSDGFGLAANRGGRDLIGGGGGGNRNAWYAGIVQQQIQQALSRNKKLRSEEFRVVVNIWLRADGAVQRSELVGSSGKSDTDEVIRTALSDLPPLKEAPPGDMPQPVRLRITNRF